MLNVNDRFITRTGRETAEDAAQIFGGRSITASGMGKLIENVSPHELFLAFYCCSFLRSVSSHFTV